MSRAPTIITLRDWDLCHKPIWPGRTDSTWTGLNKIGFVTRDDTVVYPYGRGIRRLPLVELKRRCKIGDGWQLDGQEQLDNIETFFTMNADNPRLFFFGAHALLRNTRDYFDPPIKLPRLEPIMADEFERRWATLKLILRPADMIFSCDLDSRVSRLITRFDHGPWSHTILYLGNGRISEATPPVVREIDLEFYHSRRYRLGVYRPPGPVTEDKVRAFAEFARSQVGKPYNYRGALRLARWKLFDHTPNFQARPHQLSPNDAAVYAGVRLIHVV